MSLDLRSRSDAEVTEVPALQVLDRVLPEAFATRPEAAAAAATSVRPLRPLVLEVEGRSWTLRAEPDGPVVAPGREVHAGERVAVVRLRPQQVADLAADQITPIGLMTSGELDQPEGRIGHLLDWWLVLRAALDDVHPLAPADVSLPADLHRSFERTDDPSDMADFLAAAGYLHIRGLFSAAEMAAVSHDMDAARDRFSPDDGRSWWAGTADGQRHLVRMQAFDEHSPTAARLLDDERFTALGSLGRAGHVHTGLHANRIEALFKPIGITTGISDVPWHKDCSLGRHSYECCTLTVGVSVTGAGAGSGQLRVVAGSHRARMWPSLQEPAEIGLPEVPLPTETGDVTVHLSCTLHMAEPPTERERRVMYTTFRLPPRSPEATEAARRRLYSTARERAPLTTDQPASST